MSIRRLAAAFAALLLSLVALPASAALSITTIDSGYAAVSLGVDGADNLYVWEQSSAVIHKYTAASNYASSSIITPAHQAFGRLAVAANGDIFYVRSGSSAAVYKIPFVGGVYGAEVTVATGLNYAEAVTVDSAGNVFIGESNSYRILKAAYSGGVYSAPAVFYTFPMGIYAVELSVDGADNLYLSKNNYSGAKLTAADNYATEISIDQGGAYAFKKAVMANGDLYYGNAFNNNLMMTPYLGGAYGSASIVSNAFNHAADVQRTSTGKLFVANYANSDDANASILMVSGIVTPPAITGLSPSSGQGAGGTGVTISGSGFTGATAVTFGGTAATSFTVVNDGQITAVAPPHALGSFQVQVTTPSGSSADTAADDYTFLAPVPTLGEWAMIMLAALMAGGGLASLRRRTA